MSKEDHVRKFETVRMSKSSRNPGAWIVVLKTSLRYVCVLVMEEKNAFEW